MKNLIKKFESIFYIILFLTKQSNDYHYKYVRLQDYLYRTGGSDRNGTSGNTSTLKIDKIDSSLPVADSPLSESLPKLNKTTLGNGTNEQIRRYEFEKTLDQLCNYEKSTDITASDATSRCLVTLIPCGDVLDWSNVVKLAFLRRDLADPTVQSVLAFNRTFNQDDYADLLRARSQVNERLNKVHISIRKHFIINIVQEKLLGRDGNSYYYLKQIKNLDIPDAYVSFNYVDYINKYYWGHPVHLKENTCDYMELTIFNERHSFIERKFLLKSDFDAIKREYPALFGHHHQSSTNKATVTVTKSDNIQIKQELDETGKNTKKLKIALKTTLNEAPPTVPQNDSVSKNHTDATEHSRAPSFLKSTVVNNVANVNQSQSQVNPDAAASTISVKNRESMRKFYFNFESHKLFDLNQMYKKYLSSLQGVGQSNDNIVNYMIVQDKISKSIYLNVKTRRGKYYSNELVWSQNENKFYFKFKKTTFSSVKLKNVEGWSLLRYEIHVPRPNCVNNHHYYQDTDIANYNNNNNNNNNNNEIKDDYGFQYDCAKQPCMANFINCENFDEKIFFEELNQREINKKYKEIHQILDYENRMTSNYDRYRCILVEYFGKIFTCDGRLLRPEEYGFLKSRNLNFLGLILAHHGKTLIVMIDPQGNIEDYREAVNARIAQNLINVNSQLNNGQICHECQKLDLRTKAENTQAYNQYKQALKGYSETYEKYAILFLIFVILSMFWFKNNTRKTSHKY